MSLLDECYISYLNLDHRTDRLEHMQKELARVGITAERTRGKLPHEFDLIETKLQVMKNRTPGAVGCHYGQVEIMQKALLKGKHAMVYEDDCLFGSDYAERLTYIEKFMQNNQWDIWWLGGTVHINPAWWHGKEHESILKPYCNCNLERDMDYTGDERIIRTYGAFSTFAYIVHKDFIELLLEFLEANIHISIGIDFLMILLQPQIKSYMMLPGAVRQIDNKSDIGFGDTIFSGFAALGSHWYSEKI